MKKNKSIKGKAFEWKDVKVSFMGKDITGVRAVKIEETGLEVTEHYGLMPTIKMTDAETGKEIK